MQVNEHPTLRLQDLVTYKCHVMHYFVEQQTSDADPIVRYSGSVYGSKDSNKNLHAMKILRLNECKPVWGMQLLKGTAE